MRFLDIGVILILSVAVGSCAKPQSTEAPGAVCSLPETSVLPAALTAQETNLWCWAASGEMIMDFHQHGVSQCLQANNELNRPDCCSLIKPDLCIQGGWPEFDKYNFTFKRTTDKELTWDQVREQIACKRSPIAFSWHWVSNGFNNGGHMMVIRGYTSVDGVNYVYVNDPWPPVPDSGEQRIITYDEYVSGSTHNHWHDFYDIKYQ